MTSLALLALTLAAGGDDVARLQDLLFHHSDLKAAASMADGLLTKSPDDPDVLELAVVAHAALGEDSRANALAAKRAERGDARGAVALLYAWERAHTSPPDAERLAAAARKLLPKLNPLQAAAVRRALGSLDRTSGNFEAASTEGRLPGQLTDWQVLGPFENDEGSGFDTRSPPEDAVRLNETYQGKVGKIGWRKLATPNWDGTLCLDCAVSPSSSAVAYLATWVKVGGDTDALVWGEGSGQLAVFVNGRLAGSDRLGHRQVDGQVRAGVRLHGGWNQLLVKSAVHTGDWNAGLRLTRMDGQALDGLSTSVDAPAFTPAAEDDHWPKPPEDGLTQLLSTKESALPNSYFKAWRTFDIGRPRDALDEFAALQSKGPKCALCEFGAALAAKDSAFGQDAIVELNQAIDDDPAFSRAAVAKVQFHGGLGLDREAEHDAEQGLAGNPADPQLLTLLAELRLKRGFTAEAARLAERAEAAAPDWAETAQIRAAVLLAMGDHPGAAAKLEKATSQGRGWLKNYLLLASVQGLAGRYADGAKTLRGWLGHQAPRAHVVLELSLFLLQAGDEAGLAAQLAESARLNPDWPLADRLDGERRDRAGDQAGAVSAFQRALAKNPADFNLRDRLEILQASADPAAQAQTASAEVRRRAASALQSSYPASNAVILLDEGTQVLHPDGSVRVRGHWAVKAFDEAGLRRYQTFQLPSWLPNAQIELAGAYSSTGEFVEASQVERGELHFPSATKNSTFEVIFTADVPPRAGPIFWGERAFGHSAPAIEQRWIVERPASRPLQIWKRGEVSERHVTLPDGELVVFEEKNRQAIPAEDEAAPPSAYRDLAVVSTFADWSAVERWTRAAVDDQLALDVKDSKVKELAQQITARRKTVDEKVAALAAFVRRDIHYNQLDTDIYRWRAHPARQILRTHQGDCKDKATLFMALARNVGVVVEDAILLINYDGTTPTEVPTLWFNHAAAFLPPQPGLTRPGLLDLTADEFGINATPFGDQLANALVFSPGGTGYRFEKIPADSPQSSTRHFAVDLTLNPDGQLAAKILATAHGAAAAEYRYRYRDAPRRSEFLDQEVSFVLPGTTRTGAEKTTGLEEVERDVTVEVNASGPGPLRAVGDQAVLRLVVPPIEHWTRQTSRMTPLRAGAPLQVATTYQLQLPPGASVPALPNPVHLDGAYFSYSASAKRSGDHALTIETVYARKVAEVAPADFPAFRAAALQVERAGDLEVALAGFAAPSF